MVKKYAITVKEILKRTVIVEGEDLTLKGAINKVNEAVESDDLVLDFDDFDGREIGPSDLFKNGEIHEEDVNFYYHLGEEE